MISSSMHAHIQYACMYARTKFAFPNSSCTAVLAAVLVTVVQDSFKTWKENSFFTSSSTDEDEDEDEDDEELNGSSEISSAIACCVYIMCVCACVYVCVYMCLCVCVCV